VTQRLQHVVSLYVIRGEGDKIIEQCRTSSL